MAIDIDGIAVLHAIAANPLAFPDVTMELNKVARTLVVKQLKAKAMTLERLRHIHVAIGGEAFVLALDDLGDSDNATLVKKLDKDNPELKTAPPLWCRKRLADLASGAARPAQKPVKPVPKAHRKKSKGKKSVLTPEQANLAAELKAKTINLNKARDLWREAGETSFMLVLGGLTDAKKSALAKKLDKDNPDLKSASPEWCRQRIADLASGSAEPFFKNILESKAMAATRTRTSKAR